jgi:hypothetical protein
MNAFKTMNAKPSAVELATIAAALAKNPTAEPAPTIARAWLFYEAAEEHLAQLAETQAKVNEARALTLRIPPVPVKQAQLLPWLMPEYRGDTARQGRAWREFRKGWPPGRWIENHMGRLFDVGEIMEELATKPIAERWLLVEIYAAFRAWFDTWKTRKTSEARSVAGKASHAPGGKRDKRRGSRADKKRFLESAMAGAEELAAQETQAAGRKSGT